jgi:hypothetical protein
MKLMTTAQNDALPGYTHTDIKGQLLSAGCSGTIYALVMPESEKGLNNIIFGPPDNLPERPLPSPEFFAKYHEAWLGEQDFIDHDYFEAWLNWSQPVLSFNPESFRWRYPTAGASEGIAKIIAEYATQSWAAGQQPSIHIFDGDYEGFAFFAAAYRVPVQRHRRDDIDAVVSAIAPKGQFWISQPSSIDGNIWRDFDLFAKRLSEQRPDVQLIVDLSYVGAVARDYVINLDYPSIRALVISQSKPFGGYYHRSGAVLSKFEYATLFGNRWFKNLNSIAWAIEMMTRYSVRELPIRYRDAQAHAAARIAARLGLQAIKPCDILMLGSAPVPDEPNAALASLARGVGSDRHLRICLTPTIASLVDPDMARRTARIIELDGRPVE